MRDTPVPETMLRTRLAAFSRQLPPARQGHPEAVHQARVATRRLRAVLPVVSSGRRRRKLERTIRRLTRALGPLRELDVAIAMLEDFHRAGQISDEGRGRLLDLLEAERRSVRGHVVKRIDRLDVEKLRRRAVAAVRHAIDGAPLQPREWARAARRRAARRADLLRTVVEQASGMYLPDRLHEIRIATKKLRYTLEVAREWGSGRGGSARPSTARTSLASQIALLKRTQDLLGRVHDLEILIAWTRAVQSARNAPDLRVSGDLDLFVRRLETECRRLHGQYVASRPQLLELCDRVTSWAQRAARAASAA